MSIKNNYRLLILLSIVFNSKMAAQAPLYSNYTGNQNWLNPAFAGTSGTSRLNIGYQSLWASIAGMPRNANLTLDFSIGKGKIRQGAGFDAFSNHWGEGTWGQSYARGAYALSFPVFKERARIAAGFAGGIVQYLREYHPPPWLCDISYKTSLGFSFSAGLLYYSRQSWLSVAVSNTPVLFPYTNT